MKLPEREFKKKELLKNAKHIICISEQTKKDLIKFYKLDKRKISVVYLGAEDEKYKIVLPPLSLLSKEQICHILWIRHKIKQINYYNL